MGNMYPPGKYDANIVENPDPFLNIDPGLDPDFFSIEIIIRFGFRWILMGNKIQLGFLHGSNPVDSRFHKKYIEDQ